jgi:hypothetical protein
MAPTRNPHLFETYQYARRPYFRPHGNGFRGSALNGLAACKQIVMHSSSEPDGPKANLLLYVPGRRLAVAPPIVLPARQAPNLAYNTESVRPTG